GAAIYQVTPSTNTWTSIAGPGANHTSPHADSRYMVFATYGFSNDILEADDGGIYRLHTYDQAARNWTSDFADLGITQIASVAYDTNGNIILAGNQDTGNVWKDTAIQNSLGNNKSFTSPADANGDTRWGDGNTQAVDGAGTRYILGNNFSDFSRRENGAASAVPVKMLAPGPGMISGLTNNDQNAGGLQKIPIATNPADLTKKRL